MRTLFGVLSLTALAVAPLSAQAPAARQAGGPAAPPAWAANMPAVGAMAPDFTAMVATKDGTSPAPVTLSKLRGKVVVLAFYPGDRTSGCTIELTKFAKEYDKLFSGGDGVVLLSISHDNLASHTSWAKDVGMEWQMIADTTAAVAKLFASDNPTARAQQGFATPGFHRTLYVIGKDGKIAYSVASLNVNSEDEYTNMVAAIAKAKQ